LEALTDWWGGCAEQLLSPQLMTSAEGLGQVISPDSSAVTAPVHLTTAGTSAPLQETPASSPMNPIPKVQNAQATEIPNPLEKPQLPSTDDPLAVVNALHAVLAKAGLHADLGLPQIAAVGSQSVGKTSVLESLVGRDFLPRGTGIVTRRPLVLQLHATSSGGAEWAEFGHRTGDRFTDFKLVRQEIEVETDRVCGDGCSISDVPLILHIYSPSVLDLTLVDLPGLTKVPTGKQPADVAERIRKLVMHYISQPSCLILAVSGANIDLATSDALAIAREVDPHGERTLGVLTKLDLVDESGNALEALQGHVYPLRLGYTGVVCRSEAASKAGKSFTDAVKAEEVFLQKKIFRQVAGQCGIPYLARRLNELLLRHIQQALPALRRRVHAAAEEQRQQLASFGDFELQNRLAPGPFLLHLISLYVQNFADALAGRLAYNRQEPLPDKLVGGARLSHIFHRVFASTILDFDAFNGLPDLEIRAAMRNASGQKPQLFIPEVAFESLVRRQIQKLEEPSLQCVRLVNEELEKLASQSEAREMERFPDVREKILEVARKVIKRCWQPTNSMVTNVIKIELAHVNVDHPDFIGGSGAMSRLQETTAAVARVSDDRGADLDDDRARPQLQPTRRPPGANLWSATNLLVLPPVPSVVVPSGDPSEKELMDTELLKSLVSSYFGIVKRKVIDAVPKTIMHFMVNAVRDALHHECIAELYHADLFSTLLQEGEELKVRREECQRRLVELRSAQNMLAQMRDVTI